VRRCLLPVLLLAATRLPAQSPPPAPPPNQVATSLLLFAGGDTGLHRSRDWGNTWQRVEKGLEDLKGVNTISTAAPNVYVGGEGGFFLSRDFGETWTRPYKDSPVYCLIGSRYPEADPTVFLGTPDGLLRSSDLGKTFKNTPLKGTPILRIEWPGPDLLVVTPGAVLVSQDGGATFRPGRGLPEGESRALALSSFYQSDPVLFAAADWKGVYRSRDGALTWALVGLTGRRVNDLVWLGPFLYAASDEGIHESEDAGDHWRPLGEGLPRAVLNALLFPSAPASAAEVFVASDVGLFHSMDAGLHWLPSGLKGEIVRALATFPPPSTTKKPKR
jgi:photosystem II stability/assembly factor-like uncharacterized protein